MPNETHQKPQGIYKKYTAATTDDGLHQLAFHNSVQPGIISRIVQEQLNKILKHAKATEVTFSLSQIKTSTVLFISDNGVGFDTNQKLKRTGIVNIKSRQGLTRKLILFRNPTRAVF